MTSIPGRGGPLSRREFAQRLRIGIDQVSEVERLGFLGPATFRAYERFLRRRGKLQLAARLRFLRARLELLFYPTPDRGGVREAGLLLHYVRALVPGLSKDRLQRILQRRLEPPVPLFFVNQCEAGFQVMPKRVLRGLADHLVGRGLFLPDEADRFVQRIASIYEAAGLPAEKPQVG